MKNKDDFLPKNGFYKAYITGFLIILALPLASATSWFVPTDFGKTIILRTILAVCVCLLTWQLLYKKQQLVLPPIKHNIIFWLLLALFGAFSVATLTSVDVYFSLWGSPLRSGGLINFGCYITLAILSFLIIKKEDWQKVWQASIIIATLVSCVGLVQYYGLFSKFLLAVPDRPPATVGNPIFLAIYLLFFLFITLSFAIKETDRNKRIYYSLAIALFSWVILITVTRAAFLGILIGGLYFLIFYNKRFLKIKLAAGIGMIAIISSLVFISTFHALPAPLYRNNLVQSIGKRVSVETFFNDNRFLAWRLAANAFKSKPLLGFGPENFHVAFDRFYNPLYIPFTGGAFDWWDRAHDIALDIGIQAGALGLAAYFLLFGFLLFKLQQAKRYLPEKIVVLHGLQSALTAYMVANFFSFDSFTTYFIYFLTIGYCMHLIYSNRETPQPNPLNIHANIKGAIMTGLVALAIIFIWQYNIVPLFVNSKINKAENLAVAKKCDAATAIMDGALNQHSYLDAYMRLEYVNLLKTCASYYPQNDLTYAKRGVEIMKGAVVKQPLYSRLWLALGSFTNVLASQEKDATKKASLIAEANSYFDHVNSIAPNHQEVFIEKAKLDKTAGDYQKMAADAQSCIDLNPDLGDCWWQLGLAQIYLNDVNESQKTIQQAQAKHFDTNTFAITNQLLDAYIYIKDYQHMAATYLLLTGYDAHNAQYHASLAYVYRQLGQYNKARYEVNMFLQLAPDQKAVADEFLKTLP